jgi:hypothetical protein
MFCLMCNMQVFWLDSNRIGDVGLQAFADALGKGALPKCTIMYTFGNLASAEAEQAVQDAIASRA